MKIPQICELCEKQLSDGDRVSVLLPANITEKGCPIGEFRLKLSEESLNNRFRKIFCQDCLNMDHYIDKSNN